MALPDRAAGGYCRGRLLIRDREGQASGGDSAEDFAGTDRFLVQRRVGSGAFGVVYEAYDRRDRARVALKVLRTAEADALYRFKNDFRSLADVRHPNLVSFYELFTESGHWFFSMELIPGVDFLEYLAGAGADRVRRVVGQLALGLHAVHRHGLVHRDVKPSNVLVEALPGGGERAVLLDFGLAAELRPNVPGTPDTQLIGTPAYMSPEQVLALPGAPAGDWYGVGVMLFQALTGELPFQGSLHEILAAKQVTRAPGPRALRPCVPADLDRLCRGLLEPDPEVRLTGEEVLRRLEGAVPDELPAPTSGEALLVGRGDLLAELAGAFDASREGAVAVHVRGESGMGKTALLQRFARDVLARDAESVLLAGRCYVQESVPYKALDHLVDNLSRFLLSLPREAVDELLAAGDRSGREGAAELARLFPVLRRVPAIADAPASADLGAGDPQGARRRAFAALRGLLSRIAEQRPLVLMIDDLQWGDVDSFRLLDEIFKGPEPPRLLLIASYRSEDRGTSPFLRTLVGHREALRWRGVDVREMRVERLSARASRELLRRLEDRGCRVPDDEVADLVREAGGSPLFLSELAFFSRHRNALPDESPGVRPPGVWLRDVILARVRDQGEAALRLLRVIAVAGRPLDLEAARQAAAPASDAPDTGWAEALARLRGQRLIRELTTPHGSEVETYHDQIRQAVLSSLDVRSLREIHGSLAEALESSGRADPETLAVHFQATEEVERARGYAVSAAERAERALAFERAARLYRLALDLSAGGAERYRLQVRLGTALANAGRSREAAEIYLRAVQESADRSGPAGASAAVDPLDVQRRAAEKLLTSGHVDRGLAILRHVLRRAGMRLEDRKWKALLRLWVHRLRLRWRGTRFRERPAGACDPETLERIDICWSVEVGLCLVDVLHASEFHARHLVMALDAGEPSRIARGLAMEVYFGAMDGRAPGKALAAAGRLAERVDDPYAACLLEMAQGMTACSRGRWERAEERLTRAEEMLRAVRPGVAWELDTALCFRVVARLGLGRWRELFADLPGLLEPAREQGNLYLEIHLRHWVESLRDLADDRPDRARRLLAGPIPRWSQEGFHYQHFGHLYAQVELALYEGRGTDAWRLLRDRWVELADSMIQRIEMVLVQSHDLEGRAALAAACEAQDDPRRRARLVVKVRAGARRLERVGRPWPRALARVLRAGAGAVMGDRERARRHLEAAGALFEGAAMKVHAAIARKRLAELEVAAREDGEGDGGSGRRSVADRELRGLGIRSPARLAAMLAPGFPAGRTS